MACTFEHLLLVNPDTNLNTVFMFIKLSHDGFPEITHFPDSVLKASCRSFILLFGKREEFLNLFPVIQTNKHIFLLIQKTAWRTADITSRF